MTRDTNQRLADILTSIERCQRYADALGSDDPVIAQMAEDAVERNLQIIGEAANHLPARITDAHPGIPGPQVRGFRNILVHQYFGVDATTIRDVVKTHLPPLAEALRSDLDASQVESP